MTTLTIDTITTISRAIAADYDRRLHVVGVVSTNRESGRAELLVHDPRLSYRAVRHHAQRHATRRRRRPAKAC